MRAVVAVPVQLPLFQEGGDLFRSKPVASTHGGVASHQAEQVVEQLLPVRRLLPRRQVAILTWGKPTGEVGRARLDRPDQSR